MTVCLFIAEVLDCKHVLNCELQLFVLLKYKNTN